MKNLIKILAFSLLFLGVYLPIEAKKEAPPKVEFVAQDTANMSVAYVKTEIATFVHSYNPFSERKSTNGINEIFALTALTGIRRKTGPKPGGNKRLYICPIDQLEDEEFPTYAMAVAGEITDPIPLLSGKKFTEIQAAYDTNKWGFASKGKTGNQSFEQNVGFEVYGIDKDSTSLVANLLNRPCVIIALGNNNTKYFVGSIDVPLEFEIQADSGGKGSDPQKIAFTAKNDGFMFPVIPLGTGATFAIEPLSALS